MDFAVEDLDLAPYVAQVNGLLDARGCGHYGRRSCAGR